MSTYQLLENFSENLDLSPAHRQKLVRIAEEIRDSKNRSEINLIRGVSNDSMGKRDDRQSRRTIKLYKDRNQEPSPIISASRLQQQQSSPYRVQNTFISSSMEHYVSHLKNLTNEEFNKIDQDDIDQTTGRPKSVEKYIQKAMERRQRVKQSSIRASSIDPGSRSEIITIGRVNDSCGTSSIPIVSGSVQDTVPSLAYKLKLEQNDPLLRLHLPEQNNKSCPTVEAAERVLAQHREWMEERREQKQKQEKRRPKKYKIDDINDLQQPHAEDCYVYQQARNVVSVANDLQRAKMFRITRNSSSGGSSPPTVSASSYLAGARNNSTYIHRESQGSQLQNQGIASLLAAREGLTPFQPAISSPSAPGKNQQDQDSSNQDLVWRQQLQDLTPNRRLLQASSCNLQEIIQGKAQSQEGSYEIDQNQLKYFRGRHSQILNSFAQIVSQLQDNLSDDLSKIKLPLEEFKRLSTVKAYPKNVI